MNKLKYIGAVLIAVAGLGFQQAQAHLLDPQTFFLDNPLGSGTEEAAYLSSHGYTDECCQYLGKQNANGSFENGAINISQYVTITHVSGTTWDVSWDLTGSGFTLCGVLIKDGAVNQQQIYRFYGVSADETVVGSGTVSFADIQNGRNISHISFFGCAGQQVPDGGTTVMLLGAALSSLGVARRYLKK
jgi:hypothetical protein